MTGKDLPPISPILKPKPKGKMPKPPKLSPPPDIECLDVFKAILDADAGAESWDDPEQTFQKYIHYLSKPQLSRLERRILRLKKKILDTDERRQKKQEVCDQVVATIQQRFQRSNSEEISLDLDIKNKLDQLPIQDVRRSPSGRLQSVQINNRWISISKFIRQQFFQELQEIKKLLDEGVLIRYHQRYGSYGFIKKSLNKYL